MSDPNTLPDSFQNPVSSATPPETPPQPLSAPQPSSSFAPTVTESQSVFNQSPATTQPAAPKAARLEPIAPEPPRASSATNPLIAMLSGALLAAALLGSGIWIGRAGNVGTADVLAPSGGVVAGVNAKSSSAVVRAVAMVGPAVMNVDTTFGKDPTTASDFLPRPGSQSQNPENGPREGKGTGFVIDSKNGYMLTNAHVVANAQKIQVTTGDGDKYTGIVKGFDRRTDIAVVQLSNRKLPQAKLANFKSTKELPIGDWAIAIGNPFGQENTVTVGVLSAVGRTLPVPEGVRGEAFSLTDMMQTDAAINPGNSGGPLCNLNGEVIGINTAIIPYGQGLGFTIPINKAKSIADQIIKNGKVLHPYIGVVLQPVTDALQSDYGLSDKNGALVQNVAPNSPAAQSGLQPGDVISKLNGQVMKSREEVIRIIGDKKVGDVIKIEVLRNNSVKKSLSLKVGDRRD